LPTLTSATSTYSWSLTASADAVTEPTQITDGTATNIQVAQGRGIAVDNTPTSPYFGNVYVSASNNNYTGGRQGAGIYAFNAALETINDEAWKGGIAWDESSVSSPNAVGVDGEGNVFIADWCDSHGGVWYFNPGEPETFKNVFADGETASSGLVTIDGAKVHGSVCALCVTGAGTGRILYTSDEDINANNGEIFQYNIGTLATPWAPAPTAALGNADGRLYNANQLIASDGRGGLWCSQYRWNESDAYPCVLHVNAAGVWDFASGDKSIFVGSTPAGAMAVNVEGDLIAVCGGDNGTFFNVAKISYDAAGTPSLELAYGNISFGSYGTRDMAAAFDAAGNIYIQFNNNDSQGGIGVWALPKEKNEFTTPAAGTIEVGGAGIQGTVVANAMQLNGGILTADNVIRVYSASGVLVAEGTAIDTATLAGGIYIATDGNRTIKIAK
ncbi:MAG: hypothetical protein NC131_16125, partial [Roseburia sp.]|nr:hypothetical protein [Roseburia sp.]